MLVFFDLHYICFGKRINVLLNHLHPEEPACSASGNSGKGLLGKAAQKAELRTRVRC